ncbi:sugar ABC transporter substrate-binding protein [Marinovum sp. 2_MG-2023]|uniref:sugar ABC transporter substrate-binding protein n=1 Tax=unclassified Marinovum TaxID=2647166 RepID=UPI0026E2A22F|nr:MULTISPECIES: sugar ABC transporter substrate-binding protein [unclassified Marinovum]MDO6729145.1 sugar ABC transporter substrate-binding protein [Marinovum sp. 2_MG-2023]MDO6779228.1 sugar ABC transporter substrate-binding protein [Marinovum sp. 1_MG-2023]
MKKLMTSAALAALLMGGTAQAEGMNIVFTHHSSASNTFWQAVKKGFDDACGKIGANCQMIFTQTEGSIEQQAANMEAALARSPDALLTSIVDDRALDDIIQRAVDAGVITIAVNVDDSEGAAGNARAAFVGQGFRPAGYALGTAMSAHFPAEGPIKVLVGISAPGQNWSEARGGGVLDFMADYKAANPDRDISYERIDSGTDLAVTANRVGAYLNANPDTTAYFDTGFWHASVARVLKDRGIAPGEVLLGGFDLVPEAVQQMQAGYIQAQVDQQPYMQGFIPVMQAYLAHTVDLAPANVDTGQGIVTPADADTIMELSVKGLR